MHFIVVHSCILLQFCVVFHSCGPLFHFTIRGRVNIFVFVVIFVVDLINILDVFPVRGYVGEHFGLIPDSILILEEQAPVSVLDVKAPWFAECKSMHAIDCFFQKGDRIEALLVHYSHGGEAHE